MRAAPVLLVCLLGCATAPPAQSPNADARTGIAQAQSLFVAAALLGNGDRVATVFTDDATVLLASGTVQGHAAIADLWRARLAKARYLAIEFTDVRVTLNGDYAYESGVSHVQVQAVGAAPQLLNFRYLTVWRHGTDGLWRIAADCLVPVLQASAGQ